MDEKKYHYPSSGNERAIADKKQGGKSLWIIIWCLYRRGKQCQE